MTETQQKVAAKDFAERWKDRGYEKGESQVFWLDLLQNVYGVAQPTQFVTFEEQVHLDHTSFIDVYIPSTMVMIEQKGLGKNLNQPIKQSDGSLLTPFQQAKRYITDLPRSQHPRWVVTCNFAEFWVYDMEKPTGDPEIIRLADLEKDYYRMQFLVDSGSTHLQQEMAVSIAAGEIVGRLYDAFRARYPNPDSDDACRSLNILCVRLVFCLYAEDSGVFPIHLQFHDYLAPLETHQLRKALVELFRVLDTPEQERDPYLAEDDPSLAAFPYVNGGLFSQEDIHIPPFTEEIRQLLLEDASAGFNWREISPTIFGAVFESTMNPETRRSGGMHYTSIENIHKVIDPLFLDGLEKSFKDTMERPIAGGSRRKALQALQEEMASLTFLDPACGSGNFLTESYLSLRRLENKIIAQLTHETLGQTGLFAYTIGIKVSIGQFFGIEINDFAVSVAKTALWIAESQMMKETEEIIGVPLDFLPLKNYQHILEGNALRMNWEDIVPKRELNYIMGNPPFVGNARLSDEQKQDRNSIFSGKGGELDYVSCWYKKSADFITNCPIKCAFVSTNSICQGQQVAPLWQELMDAGIVINFAYRTFVWDSEASLKAHVYCIVVGFSKNNNDRRLIYTGEGKTYREASNINGYLMDAPNVFITKRRIPLCNVPIVIKGFQPTDNGNLILDDDERNDLLSEYPEAEKWIRPFITAKEYIHGKNRWCLWLEGISPADLNRMVSIKSRVSMCKKWRENQTKSGDAYKLKDSPTMMRPSSKFKESSFIILPRHTGESRKYVPFGFAQKGAIPGDSISVVIDATLYHFGILCSNVHNAWMRTVCGRLEMRYRYSSDIVYNNFPWPEPSEEQKSRIEQTAQAILDARSLYPDSSLADLYDEVTMPPELRTAHQRNDKAVMAAYGWTSKDEAYSSESACVAELMKMYQRLCGE